MSCISQRDSKHSPYASLPGLRRWISKLTEGGLPNSYMIHWASFSVTYRKSSQGSLPGDTAQSCDFRSSGWWVAGVVTIYSAVLPGLNHHPTVICKHETETWREDTLLKSDMLGFKMQTTRGNSTSTRPGTSRRLMGKQWHFTDSRGSRSYLRRLRLIQ